MYCAWVGFSGDEVQEDKQHTCHCSHAIECSNNEAISCFLPRYNKQLNSCVPHIYCLFSSVILFYILHSYTLVNMSALNVFLLNNAFCVCSCMNMLNIIISGVNVSLKPSVDTSLNYTLFAFTWALVTATRKAFVVTSMYKLPCS